MTASVQGNKSKHTRGKTESYLIKTRQKQCAHFRKINVSVRAVQLRCIKRKANVDRTLKIENYFNVE